MLRLGADQVAEFDRDAGADVLRVAAAIVLRERHLLVVSKKIAPEVFYLPGGKPEVGESAAAAVTRELREELSVGVRTLRPWGVVEEIAAIEGIPMRVALFRAEFDGEPRLAAELVAMRWTNEDTALAPALRLHVLPKLWQLDLVADARRKTAE